MRDPMPWKNIRRRENPVSKAFCIQHGKKEDTPKTRKKLQIRSAGWP
jgi:hypothetical protein